MFVCRHLELFEVKVLLFWIMKDNIQSYSLLPDESTAEINLFIHKISYSITVKKEIRKNKWRIAKKYLSNPPFAYKINVTKPLSPSLTILSIVSRILFLANPDTFSVL